jgi:hypothetical protein
MTLIEAPAASRLNGTRLQHGWRELARGLGSARSRRNQRGPPLNRPGGALFSS